MQETMDYIAQHYGPVREDLGRGRILNRFLRERAIIEMTWLDKKPGSLKLEDIEVLGERTLGYLPQELEEVWVQLSFGKNGLGISLPYLTTGEEREKLANYGAQVWDALAEYHAVVEMLKSDGIP